MFRSALHRLSARFGYRPQESATASELARFSNLAATSRRRHIQTLHEPDDLRNPDILAGAFMTAEEREECRHLPAAALAEMRGNPFYYYLTARTRYYDQLLLDSVAGGIRRILLLGAGHDTRFYRFGEHLAALGVAVAECDQPEAITAKQELASQLPYADRVAYFAADLNVPSAWQQLLLWFDASHQPGLVCVEGVSPYVETKSFHAFLHMAAERMPKGSILSYDFKQFGVADGFGRSERVSTPFRLPLDEALIVACHVEAGFAQATLTPSSTLMRRYLPSWHSGLSPLFTEDALIQAVP